MVRTKQRNRPKRNAVSNVRIVDEYAGTDGARVDRILSSMQNSHSQIRVLCTATGQFNVNTSGPGTANYSGQAVRNTDDFTSFAAQFETYRILAIRFDVYDINPALQGQIALSTWHDVYPATTTLPTFSFEQVIDAPDSQLVPPGTGKVSITWFAKGSQENDFQTDDTTGWSDYGGLRIAGMTSTGTGTKLQIVMKAIVDFRGRY